MAERIVVSLRARSRSRELSGPGVGLDEIRLLLKRAEAMGASVCSWGPSTVSFAFAPEDLEDAIEFVTGDDAQGAREAISVGVSRGELSLLLDCRGAVGLGRGASVSRSLALARLGRAGEVLIDSELAASSRTPLATQGTRLARTEGRELRGVLLDLEGRLRSTAGEVSWSVLEPSLLGRATELRKMSFAPGSLAVVRADPGVGGTRFLRECVESAAARCLFVNSLGFSSEPLGALRRALSRDARQGGLVSLPHDESKVLAALLDGNGTDPAAAAYLLEEWLAPPGAHEPGLVVVDDAAEVDPSTLDVIASSILGATRPFRCIARLDTRTPLPLQFAPLPPGPETVLGPLSRSDSEKLVHAMMGKVEPGPWAQEWAHRGAGGPLAISEALLEALDSGELSASHGGVKVRPRSIPRGSVLDARDWIARRWAHLDGECRALLFAVVVLGGDASVATTSLLLQAAADAPVDVALVSERLIDLHWLVESQPDRIAVPSRTHAAVIAECLPDHRHAAWHRAASIVIENSESGVVRAEAARQAALAGDRRRAARLYVEAARIASDAGLEACALELLGAARAADPARVRGADSATPGPVAVTRTASTHPPISNFAAALVRKAQQEGRSSYPPIEASVAESSLDRAVIPKPPTLPDLVRAPMGEPTIQDNAPEPRQPMASILPPETLIKVREVDELAARLPLTAREALSNRDLGPLEQLAGSEAMSGDRLRVVERVRAMVAIDKGQDRGEALRVLREACKQASGRGLIEQSRSHLALAIGLARTGAGLEALTETLEALARAREARSAIAETACKAFVRVLYERSGQKTEAAAWE